MATKVDLVPFELEGASFLGCAAPSPGGQALADWMQTDLRTRAAVAEISALVEAAPDLCVVLSTPQLLAALDGFAASFTAEDARRRFHRAVPVAFEAEGAEAARLLDAMSRAHAAARDAAAPPRRGPGRRRG